MSADLDRLRKTLQALKRDRRRAPASVRGEVARLAGAAMDSGKSLAAVSRALGIREATLRAWQKAESRPSLVPVRVQPAGVGSARGLLLRGPNGVVVEGATVAEIVAILRGLG